MYITATKKAIASAAILALIAMAPLAFVNAQKPNTDCLRAGQDTLRSLDAFQAAARGEVNYANFDENSGNEFEGLIRIDLGDEAYLPLSDVFKLHLTSPELFAWCDAE